MQRNKVENNIKLLDDAYKNVRMGSYAIDCLNNKIKDSKLEKLVMKQNKFYLEHTKKLDVIAKKLGLCPKDIGPMLKASSFTSIKLKTVFNNDTSHIAEMLIEGTTMGITTLIKEVNDTVSPDEELLSIANNIISHQESFVESLKDFL